MNEAAFWVGPVEDPDRYRLTHLLGSGGEGEVWRAVRPGRDNQVAIKIDLIPADADQGWEDRLAALTELEVDGLVRVEQAFAGVSRHRLDDETSSDATHRYVVMNHVSGVTLRSWLDEHPDAPPRHRIRILRGLAATLSALHRGPGKQDPVTHGDVKPTNVIIGADGAPVLVDLGLLRPTGSGPASGHSAAYSSPELRNPDGLPSPRADTFSFAVTAMETLTSLTPPLTSEGTLDLDATRRRIATASALRLRPILRHQLLKSLTAEPERRPPTPVRVFSGRTLGIVLVPVLVVVLGAGGSAFALRSDQTPAQVITAPPPSPGAGVTATPTATVAPPRAPGSPSPTATATPTVVPDDGTILSGTLQGGSFYTMGICGTRASPVLTQPLPELATWGSAAFNLFLTSRHTLHVLSVTRTPTLANPPRTLTQTLGATCPRPDGSVIPPSAPLPGETCVGPRPKYRNTAEYVGDADRATWHEILPRGPAKPFGVFNLDCYKGIPSEVDFRVDDCHTNVDYQVTVTFQVDGDALHIYRRTFPVIRLRAKAEHTNFITSLEGRFAHTDPNFNGGPEHCVNRGVTRSTPYTSRRDEIYALFLQGVRELRQKHRLLTMREAIEKVGASLTGTDLYLPAPYGVDDILAICSEAQVHPTRWRGTCGPPDPTPATPSPTSTPSGTPTP